MVNLLSLDGSCTKHASEIREKNENLKPAANTVRENAQFVIWLLFISLQTFD